MARKSNKTEHVLKLITKNEEDDQDDLFGIRQSKREDNTSAEVEPEIAFKQKESGKKDNSERNHKPKKIKEPEEASGQRKSEEPVEPISPAEPRKSEEPVEIAGVKKALSANSSAQPAEGSAIMDQHGYLVNIAEILVREKIGLVMERMKVCTCQTCVNDVLALALNSLPTKYITTDAGRQYLQLDIYKKQYETDILAALTRACVRVKASPRHDKQER